MRVQGFLQLHDFSACLTLEALLFQLKLLQCFLQTVVVLGQRYQLFLQLGQVVLQLGVPIQQLLSFGCLDQCLG